MNNMTNMFQAILKGGIESLEDGKLDQAGVYAEFAKAIAMTGTVCVTPVKKSDEVQEDRATEIPETITNFEKDELPDKKEVVQPKEEPKLKEKTQNDEPKPEEEIKEEKEEVEEKTKDNDLETKQEELSKYLEMFGTETVEQCISEFSHNTLSSVEDITEDNIEAFVSYLDLLMKEMESA